MTHLLCGDLPTDDFLELINGRDWPPDALLMAFTPVDARFGRYGFDEPFFRDTEQGRIFSPAGELRWRRMATDIRCVYLGDAPPSEGLVDCSADLSGLAPSRRQFLLWGERTDTENRWLEQQVPHRFSYPIDSARFSRGRAALVVEDWSDGAGIARFSRYHSIKEVEGGSGNATG